MSKDIGRILDEEGAAAEEAEADQTLHDLPAQVTVSQPGRARSKVLQVRLNPEEHAVLERVAARRGVPVSTIARGELLKLVGHERSVEQTFVSTTGLIGELMLLVQRLPDIRSFADDLEAVRERVGSERGLIELHESWVEYERLRAAEAALQSVKSEESADR